MSEELVITQPQSGLWLSPGNRVDHLVAIYKVTSKESKWDQLSGKDKVVCEFTFVDLDQEGVEMVGLDNHPGVTNKLSVGNPAVVLGRITKAPSQFAQDAIVLGEHRFGDAKRLQDWWAKGKRPNPTEEGVHASLAQEPKPVIPLGNAPEVPAADPGLDLSKLDPGTLELLKKQLAQNAAG
jgi:hypothetical protein